MQRMQDICSKQLADDRQDIFVDIYDTSRVFYVLFDKQETRRRKQIDLTPETK